MKRFVKPKKKTSIVFGFCCVLIVIVLLLSSAKKSQSIGISKDSTSNKDYPIVGTNQTKFYNNSTEINSQKVGDDYYGQNANYPGNTTKYKENGDGTVTDVVTGLMWQQSPDTNGDGAITASDKMTYDEAVAGVASYSLGGYTDWRLPTIKEQFSLIIFSGVDPSGYNSSSLEGLIPFIDTNYFKFAYGDTNDGERIIDSQYASSTMYVDGELLFGVNFADGRIKGYGLKMPFGPGDKTFFVTYVRGNKNYGINNFNDNGDGTISDTATGLMWMQNDNKKGTTWQEALNYAENYEFAGYSDWRLPDVKELQSIVDYSRSPKTSDSAAIDPLFNCSEIVNEAGQKDYPFYWSSTTHSNWSTDMNGRNASYVSFGRAMGYMDGKWMDVHGAGAQRSDPKTGDPADWPKGHGPQGDAQRINNYIRLVRSINK
ncbi:MAG: hypothetical protein ACJA1P_002708 [Maribacter sp.]|jgi:hypothetical protein